MKRGITMSFIIAIALCLSGCWSKDPATKIVIVDATSSIVPTEYARIEQLLEPVVSQLDRGDRLVLVPITGEPEEKLGHRIVHLEMPSEYVTYDNNLKRARIEGLAKIKQFFAGLPAIRATQSNVLSALRASAETIRPNRQTEVICFSDMIHDYQDLRFIAAPELNDDASTAALAGRLAKHSLFDGATVKIGLLNSLDIERMSPARKAALPLFWKRYFEACGASNVIINVDLANLIERSR